MRLSIHLKFLFSFLVLLPSVCFAEDLLRSFEKAKLGELSISELLETITKSDKLAISADVNRYKHLVPGLSETSAPVLLGKVRQAIIEGDFDKVWQIKSLSDTLLPRSWPESIGIAKLAEQVSKIQDAKENILSLNSIYQEKLATEDKKVLEIAAKKKAKEVVANETSPFDAIKLASKVALVFPDLDVGTKSLFSQLDSSVDSSSIDFSKWSFDVPDVKEYVFDFLDKSDENKGLVTNLYIAKAMDAFDKGNENRAEVYYKLIQPHLSAERILSVKKEFLSKGLDGNYSSFIESIANDLKNDLSSTDKVKLLFKGFYGWWPFLIPLAFFLLPILFLLRPKKKTRLKTNPVLEDDQYTKLLKKLELDETATEKEIKKAFRLLVKKHHPDAHGVDGVVLDSDGNVDQQFEELKKTYDRLLQIQSSWFGN